LEKFDFFGAGLFVFVILPISFGSWFVAAWYMPTTTTQASMFIAAVCGGITLALGIANVLTDRPKIEAKFRRVAVPSAAISLVFLATTGTMYYFGV
jgi:hypothetical protein